MKPADIAIVGGGPAGLMAAEILLAQGLKVTIYERKTSVGRKFLMAGRGGLNLTHSEDLNVFISRYGGKSDFLRSIIEKYPPAALRTWCENLGEATFIGSSGRVFPENFKASPLLRRWVARLKSQGVIFMLHHEWQGWDEQGQLVFQDQHRSHLVRADATLLALGGASWPKLGSDGRWVDILTPHHIVVAPLEPANCGFLVQWSDMFCKKFSGSALKPVRVSFEAQNIQGEIMITEKGVEGGAIYALSATLRQHISRYGSAILHLDLKPGLTLIAVMKRLQKSKGRNSLSTYLRKNLNLSPCAIGLLKEMREENLHKFSSARLAQLIKSYPLNLIEPFPMDRAISTAGGVSFDSINEDLMLLKKPGIFVAGEMLDWEAPTGGYLLQAAFSTGVHAAHGICAWLKSRPN